jgi:hypothetical protein
MASIAGAVSQLEMRRKSLEVELASVTSRLKAIQHALEVEQRTESASGAAPAALETLPKKTTNGERPAKRKTRKLHQWFASGEAVELMKRHVRAPATASEIVKRLAKLKGYDKSLAPEQLKRFHGTAYMAVSNAVKAGSASKQKDGRIRFR